MKRISALIPTLVLFGALASLNGCTTFQRSTASGYALRDSESGMERGFSRDRKDAEREATMGQLGFADSRELSENEAEALENRIALRKAEKNLEGKREREQYFRNKPYLRSDLDRLEFLALDSFETRQRWLNAKGVSAGSSSHPPEIQSLIDINDITLGMTKQAVRDSWGEPELVEVSGNPLYGNERWRYTEQTSSTEGYQTQNRFVYFESGRVAGWESN